MDRRKFVGRGIAAIVGIAIAPAVAVRVATDEPVWNIKHNFPIKAGTVAVYNCKTTTFEVKDFWEQLKFLQQDYQICWMKLQTAIDNS